MNYKAFKVCKSVIIYCITVILLGLFLFPILWIVLTSFKTRFQTFAIPPVWLFIPTFQNYYKILFQSSFIYNLLNSVIICTVTVMISILIGTPAAYTLANYNFRRKEDLTFWILSTRMAPPIAVAIPFYLIAVKLGVIDTRLILIVVYMTFNLSFVIWMMKGFFEDLPRELDEAAMVDGCSRLQAFIRISLPLASPGLMATAIFSFIFSWNEFLFALVLTRTNARTVPIAVAGFIGWMGIRWEEMSVAAVMALIPAIVFALAIRKYLARGLTFGSLR